MLNRAGEADSAPGYFETARKPVGVELDSGKQITAADDFDTQAAAKNERPAGVFENFAGKFAVPERLPLPAESKDLWQIFLSVADFWSINVFKQKRETKSRIGENFGSAVEPGGAGAPVAADS